VTGKARTIAVLCSSTPTIDGRDGQKRECGVWAEELVAAWKVFLNRGFQVIIATPDGAPATVEPASVEPESCLMSENELNEMLAFVEPRRTELDSPRNLGTLLDEDIDGVYIPGGYGPTAQYRSNENVGAFMERCFRLDLPVAAVCHGVAALLATSSNGFAGRKVTSFSNAEEDAAGADSWVPYFLESALVERGLAYAAAEPWSSHVIEDGNLITGQNPASSEEAAKRLGHRVANA
jgi:aldehyde dehydrogenase (NAD+)